MMERPLLAKLCRKMVRVYRQVLGSRGPGLQHGVLALLVLTIVAMLFRVSTYTMATMAKSQPPSFGIRQRRQLQTQSLIERIDWNNYSLMDIDSQRTGPGEQGLGASLELSQVEKKLSETLFERHKLNAFLSNRIPLDRSIGDHRYESCKKRLYLKNIPENSVSVVIPFHNEHNSTILRTVHSVIKGSPSNILKEVILVDDASTYDYLLQPLDDYIKRHFNNVKIIRNHQRLGLMLTRVAGADASRGHYLLFLDAHVEVNYNYLPPLLEPIVLDYRTITVPMTDGIDGTKDFKYNEFGPDRGGFDWTMSYQRLPLLEKDLADITQPREVPTMLGCAFAISRRWWEELGKFDPGLKAWGGEQYEISFKAWQCGGKMLDVPCSRVGHVFRKKFPYPLVTDDLIFNFLRVASVWMDEYKEYVLQRMPKFRDKDPGDIKDRLAIRRRLKCKSFEWYLKNVAPDIKDTFPVVEPARPAYGVLRIWGDIELCLVVKNTNGSDDFGVWLDLCRPGSNSVLEYTWKQQIRTFLGGKCLVPNFGKLQGVTCSLNGIPQKFAWDQKSGWLVNLFSGRCLHADVESLTVDMQPCRDQPSMSWLFVGGIVNHTLVDQYWEKSKQTLVLSKKWLT